MVLLVRRIVELPERATDPVPEAPGGRLEPALAIVEEFETFDSPLSNPEPTPDASVDDDKEATSAIDPFVMALVEPMLAMVDRFDS